VNKINKMLALTLSTLTLATVGLSACKKKEKDTTPTVNSEYIYNGTHVYTATDTDEWLVKNGRTDYTLVVPTEVAKKDEGSLRVARTEFLDLFKDATGISMRVLTDDKVQNASDGKFISLGDTKLLENSGISVDKEMLTADGHRIVTKDDDIYLWGGEAEGTACKEAAQQEGAPAPEEAHSPVYPENAAVPAQHSAGRGIRRVHGAFDRVPWTVPDGQRFAGEYRNGDQRAEICSLYLLQR